MASVDPMLVGSFVFFPARSCFETCARELTLYADSVRLNTGPEYAVECWPVMTDGIRIQLFTVRSFSLQFARKLYSELQNLYSLKSDSIRQYRLGHVRDRPVRCLHFRLHYRLARSPVLGRMGGRVERRMGGNSYRERRMASIESKLQPLVVAARYSYAVCSSEL